MQTIRFETRAGVLAVCLVSLACAAVDGESVRSLSDRDGAAAKDAYELESTGPDGRPTVFAEYNDLATANTNRLRIDARSAAFYQVSQSDVLWLNDAESVDVALKFTNFQEALPESTVVRMLAAACARTGYSQRDCASKVIAETGAVVFEPLVPYTGPDAEIVNVVRNAFGVSQLQVNGTRYLAGACVACHSSTATRKDGMGRNKLVINVTGNNSAADLRTGSTFFQYITDLYDLVETPGDPVFQGADADGRRIRALGLGASYLKRLQDLYGSTYNLTRADIERYARFGSVHRAIGTGWLYAFSTIGSQACRFLDSSCDPQIPGAWSESRDFSDDRVAFVTRRSPLESFLPEGSRAALPRAASGTSFGVPTLDWLNIPLRSQRSMRAITDDADAWRGIFAFDYTSNTYGTSTIGIGQVLYNMDYLLGATSSSFPFPAQGVPADLEAAWGIGFEEARNLLPRVVPKGYYGSESGFNMTSVGARYHRSRFDKEPGAHPIDYFPKIAENRFRATQAYVNATCAGCHDNQWIPPTNARYGNVYLVGVRHGSAPYPPPLFKTAAASYGDGLANAIGSLSGAFNDGLMQGDLNKELYASPVRTSYAFSQSNTPQGCKSWQDALSTGGCAHSWTALGPVDTSKGTTVLATAAFSEPAHDQLSWLGFKPREIKFDHPAYAKPQDQGNLDDYATLMYGYKVGGWQVFNPNNPSEYYVVRMTSYTCWYTGWSVDLSVSPTGYNSCGGYAPLLGSIGGTYRPSCLDNIDNNGNGEVDHRDPEECGTHVGEAGIQTTEPTTPTTSPSASPSATPSPPPSAPAPAPAPPPSAPAPAPAPPPSAPAPAPAPYSSPTPSPSPSWSY